MCPKKTVFQPHCANQARNKIKLLAVGRKQKIVSEKGLHLSIHNVCSSSHVTVFQHFDILSNKLKLLKLFLNIYGNSEHIIYSH